MLAALTFQIHWDVWALVAFHQYSKFIWSVRKYVWAVAWQGVFVRGFLTIAIVADLDVNATEIVIDCHPFGHSPVIIWKDLAEYDHLRLIYFIKSRTRSIQDCRSARVSKWRVDERLGGRNRNKIEQDYSWNERASGSSDSRESFRLVISQGDGVRVEIELLNAALRTSPVPFLIWHLFYFKFENESL